jgi:aminoglycoside phosphotransferase (APT) family kinase protein
MSLDLGAVSAWMAGAVPGAQPIESAEKIQGGQSNPTYILHARATRVTCCAASPGACF